jgi:hypothetical protein
MNFIKVKLVCYKYCPKKDGMGRACIMHRINEKCIHFGQKTQREETTLKTKA